MKLPQVSGPRLLRRVQALGFYVKRQTGWHAVVVHQTDPKRRAIIPIHGSKPIRPGTLRSILSGLQLTVEDLK